MRERIAAEGPITVEAYMEACNAYYYATRDPLGARGDFTTAPEISQMFGEMVGAALADCWQRAGAPAEAVYVELGPGRGTLAGDALRVHARRRICRVPSISSRRARCSRPRRPNRCPTRAWHDDVESLPEAPLLLVANEFFDALPIRQMADGQERKVMVAAGGLAFDRDGEIVEQSPARESVARTIAARLARNGGAALIIDYGHARSAPGDTLQAVRGHAFAPILASPGEQDLTSHVDFEALAGAARASGAATTPVITQGEWLSSLGIGARAAALATANPARAGELAAAVQRLTGRDQMGSLFKVMAIHAAHWPVPAGFAA